MKFISDGTWFDKGTEAKLIEGTDYDCFRLVDGKMIPSKSGLFEGIRTGHRKSYGASTEITPDYDQEVCSFNEFTIIDEETEQNAL